MCICVTVSSMEGIFLNFLIRFQIKWPVNKLYAFVQLVRTSRLFPHFSNCTFHYLYVPLVMYFYTEI